MTEREGFDTTSFGDATLSSLLRQIIELSGEERNLRRVVRRVAEFVVAASGADVCFVHVVDRDAGELVLLGATPEPFDQLAGTIRLRVGEGLAGWVAEHAEAAVVHNKWNDPRYLYIPALRGEDYSTLVSIPLLRPHGVVVGVLNIHSKEPQHFGPDDVDRLGQVAGLLAGIVENAVLYDRLVTREAELERFAVRTIELQELDRRRIAADIHDGISQRLVSAWYHLRAARALTERDRMLSELTVTESLVSDSLEEARRAIVGLRPVVLDDLGLGPALTSLASSIGGDIEVELDLAPCSLAAHVETALFRITQEALQNVVKHASAKRVEIALQAGPDAVSLVITDDGTGFDPEEAGGPTSYGLSGMHERAMLLGADLQVHSRVGQGTAVVVRVPVVPSDDGPDFTLGEAGGPRPSV